MTDDHDLDERRTGEHHLGEHLPRLHLETHPHEGDEPIVPGEPYADAAGDSPPLEKARWHVALLALVLLAIAGTLIAILAADPVDPWVQPFDDWWLETVEANRNDTAVNVAKVLDLVGSPWVTFPVRGIAVVILLLRRRWLQLSAFVMAVLLSELAIGPVKAWIDRARPPSIVETSGASFPSGHAIAAAVTAFALVAAFLPRGRRRLHWMVAATLFASSMAWSRTYLGAHWATDTIAGTCIGAGVAILSEVVFEEGRRRAALRALEE
jgi:undecaprenyl-diphosphatase